MQIFDSCINVSGSDKTVFVYLKKSLYLGSSSGHEKFFENLCCGNQDYSQCLSSHPSAAADGSSCFQSGAWDSRCLNQSPRRFCPVCTAQRLPAPTPSWDQSCLASLTLIPSDTQRVTPEGEKEGRGKEMAFCHTALLPASLAEVLWDVSISSTAGDRESLRVTWKSQV